MRTEEWFRKRSDRAARRLLDGRECGRVDLDAVFGALREWSDDPPSEIQARNLATTLCLLRVDELRHLLHEAINALHDCSESAKHRAQQTIDIQLQKALECDPAVAREDITVAQICDTPGGSAGGIILLAVVLQSLIWAIGPPIEWSPLVVY